MSKGHRVCIGCARDKLHIDSRGHTVQRKPCAVCGGTMEMTIHVVAVQEDLLYVAPPPPPPPPVWVRRWDEVKGGLDQQALDSMHSASGAGADVPEALGRALTTHSGQAFKAGWDAANEERDPAE